MRVFVVTFALATLLAGVAHAQPSKNRHQDPRADMKADMKAARERAEIEKEYNDMMKRTRSTGPAPKTDPWSSVRSSGDTKR
jgi:hypothetical protein